MDKLTITDVEVGKESAESVALSIDMLRDVCLNGTVVSHGSGYTISSCDPGILCLQQDDLNAAVWWIKDRSGNDYFNDVTPFDESFDQWVGMFMCKTVDRGKCMDHILDGARKTVGIDFPAKTPIGQYRRMKEKKEKGATPPPWANNYIIIGSCRVPCVRFAHEFALNTHPQ